MMARYFDGELGGAKEAELMRITYLEGSNRVVF